MTNKKWIQNIDIKKGALTRTAEKKGGIKKSGGLSEKFLNEAASGKFGEITKKRANLAKTFKKIRH